MLSSVSAYMAASRGPKKTSSNLEYDFETSIKLILLGETGCGKTSLALRFSSNEFRVYSESTIGASFFETSMIVCQDDAVKRNVMFKIWDTAGQEKYHALASMYYRGAAAAILVFDISRASSFKTLQAWVQELQEKGPEDIVMVICGNKLDLDASGDRKVLKSDAEKYATSIGASYIEASAKDGTNVKELFELVAKHVPWLPTAASGDSSIDNNEGSTAINLGARPARSGCCRSV